MFEYDVYMFEKWFKIFCVVVTVLLFGGIIFLIGWVVYNHPDVMIIVLQGFGIVLMLIFLPAIIGTGLTEIQLLFNKKSG